MDVNLSASRLRAGGGFLAATKQWTVMAKFASDAQRKPPEVESAFRMIGQWFRVVKAIGVFLWPWWDQYISACNQLAVLGKQWQSQITPAVEQQVITLLQVADNVPRTLGQLSDIVAHLGPAPTSADAEGLQEVLSKLISMLQSSAEQARQTDAQLIAYRSSLSHDDPLFVQLSSTYENVQRWVSPEHVTPAAYEEFHAWHQRVMGAHDVVPQLVSLILGAWEAYASDLSNLAAVLQTDVGQAPTIIKGLGVQEAVADWVQIRTEATDFLSSIRTQPKPYTGRRRRGKVM